MTERRVPNVTDERLCWLAVREYCRKRSRRRGLLGWLATFGAGSGAGPVENADASGVAGQAMVDKGFATGPGGEYQNEQMSDKMGDYAFAVEDAAQRLDDGERQHLRATGEVPAWFLDEVERRFTELRRHR